MLALNSVPSADCQPETKGLARLASSASCVCATRASNATEVMPRAVRYGIMEAPPAFVRMLTRSSLMSAIVRWARARRNRCCLMEPGGGWWGGGTRVPSRSQLQPKRLRTRLMKARTNTRSLPTLKPGNCRRVTTTCNRPRARTEDNNPGEQGRCATSRTAASGGGWSQGRDRVLGTSRSSSFSFDATRNSHRRGAAAGDRGADDGLCCPTFSPPGDRGGEVGRDWGGGGREAPPCVSSPQTERFGGTGWACVSDANCHEA